MWSTMNRREFVKTTGLLSVAHFMETGAAAAQKGWANRYPRLYFNAETVRRFRVRLAGDAALRGRWEAFLRDCDRLVEAALVPESEAERPSKRGANSKHANFFEPARQISDMGLALGFAWHVSGDERYARKLRDALLHYTAYRRWHGPGYQNRFRPWRSELVTAAFIFGVATGYDALHGFLSEAERATITYGLVKLGVLPTLEDWVLPERRIHALDSMGHNWWSVCVSMAGVGALALVNDDPRARGWVEHVASGLEEWFGYKGNRLLGKPANFDKQGAFYESVHYADYALRDYLRFYIALNNVAPDRPKPKIDALERVGDFFLHTSYPCSSERDLGVNFGDDWDGRGVETIALLLLAGLGRGVHRWYLDRAWRRNGKSGPEGANARVVLSFLLPDQPAPQSPESLPHSVLYTEPGWAVLRSSWDEDATLLAVKCGHTWNHAHADAGSFVLFHAGRPLLIDSGVCSYPRPEYRGYYSTSRAHNVVLFNGEGQPQEDFQRGSRLPGRVDCLLDCLGAKYLRADATGPMSWRLSRCLRHWLWLDDVILVVDDLLAREVGRFDWLLHYAGKAAQNGSEIAITNGPAAAKVVTLYPERVTMREEEGLADREPERKIPYLAISPADQARAQKFMFAIIPEKPGNKPVLKSLKGDDMLGAQIISADKITDVFFNLRADGRTTHDNCNNRFEGWDTDAYLLAVTRAIGKGNDVFERVLMVDGSHVRHSGKVYWDSLVKADVLFHSGESAEVWVRGQNSGRARLRVTKKTSFLLLNRQGADFEYLPRESSVRFRLPG